MPLLSALRFIATLLSLVILAVAAYLLWSWWRGDGGIDPAGTMVRLREDWRLWLGLSLLAWSFAGRFVVLLVLARRRLTLPPPPQGEARGRTLTGPSQSIIWTETTGPSGAPDSGAPDIVLTHGWGMDSSFWTPLRRSLGDRFRVTVWDLPGLGRSKAVAPGGVGLQAFAADLALLAQGLGPPRPILVGHSIGGMTVQTLVRDHPEVARTLAGIVLLNTTYTNPLRTMILSRLFRALQKPLLEPSALLTIWLQPLVWLAKWQGFLSGSTHLAMRLGFASRVTRAQLDQTALLVTRAPPAVEARGNLSMFHWDATGALGGVTVPILVVGAAQDLLTRPQASLTLAEENAGAVLHIVDDANHMGPMERAEVYAGLIADFAVAAHAGQAHAGQAPAEGGHDTSRRLA